MHGGAIVRWRRRLLCESNQWLAKFQLKPAASLGACDLRTWSCQPGCRRNRQVMRRAAGLHQGAPRTVAGIARSRFHVDADRYLDALMSYDEARFRVHEFPKEFSDGSRAPL
jgi:hypothetical protein